MQKSVSCSMRPRLLNEKFLIHYYDGGAYSDGISESTFDIKNVLIPTRDSFHCSDSGTKKNLILYSDEPVTVTHIFIQAPRRKCTEPIANCLAWVTNEKPDLKSVSYLNDLSIDVIRSKSKESYSEDPIIISTARDTLEGETELRPFRSGHYIHLNFFDTHSETQENIDIAVVGIVGFVGRVDFDINSFPIMGPWSKRQVSPPKCVHQHTLSSMFSSRGWCCDGRDFSGGCRGGFNDFNKSSVYDVTFRCVMCGFDLCEECASDPSIGTTTDKSARLDLKSILEGTNSGRRVAVQMVRNQLRIDPHAFGTYLKNNMIGTLRKLRFSTSKDSLNLLLSVLSRLVPRSLPPLPKPDMYVADLDSTIEFVMLESADNPSSLGLPVTVVGGPSLGVIHVPLTKLVPLSNSAEVVLNTAKIFHFLLSNQPEQVETYLQDHQIDPTIRTAAGVSLEEAAAPYPHLVRYFASSTEPPQSDIDDITMEVEEMMSAANHPVVRPPPTQVLPAIKTRADWFSELQSKLSRVIFNLLYDQLSGDGGDVSTQLVAAFVALNRQTSDDVKLLILKLVHASDQPVEGLKIMNGLLSANVRGAAEWLLKLGAIEMGRRIVVENPDNSECCFQFDSLISVLGPMTTTSRRPEIKSQLVNDPTITEDEKISRFSEYFLTTNSFPLYKVSYTSGMSGNGGFGGRLSATTKCTFFDKTKSIQKKSVPVEFLAKLADIKRIVFASCPIVSLDYIRSCFDLVGSTIRVIPTTHSDDVAGTATVIDFSVTSTEVGVGLHTLKFHHNNDTCMQMNLLLRDYEVIARNGSIAPSDLAPKFTYERLRDNRLVDEIARVRPLLSQPGSIISVSDIDSPLHQIFHLIPGGLNETPNGYLVSPDGIDASILELLDVCLGEGLVGGSNGGSEVEPTDRPEDDHDNYSPSIDEDKVYSVYITVDIMEIPIELIWPMIRDEIFDSIRPFIHRSWPGYSLSRLEASIHSMVNSTGGTGKICRQLSRSEAESIAARVGNVVQANVETDRNGAIEAERERIEMNAAASTVAGLRNNPSNPPQLELGQRIFWRPPNDPSKTRIGIVVARNPLSILDEQSGCLVRNVPNQSIGRPAAAAGRSGDFASLLRDQIRDTLRRRFILATNDAAPPVNSHINEGDEDDRDGQEDTAALLREFATAVDHHEEDEEDEEDDEDDDEDEDHEMVEFFDIEAGNHSMTNQNDFASDTSPSNQQQTSIPQAAPAPGVMTRLIAATEFFGQLASSSSGGTGPVPIFLSDIFGGPGTGPSAVVPQSDPILTRNISGVERGTNLTAPIADRISAETLKISTPNIEPTETIITSTGEQVPRMSTLVLSIRRVSETHSSDWITIDDVSGEWPFLALWSSEIRSSPTVITLGKECRIEYRVKLVETTTPLSPSSRPLVMSKRIRFSSDDTISSSPPPQTLWSEQDMESLEFLAKTNDNNNPVYAIFKDHLIKRVTNQLEQILLVIGDRLTITGSPGGDIVAPRLVPSWVTMLASRYSQLLPHGIRQKIFYYSSLPVGMSIHWIQETRLGDLLKRRGQIQSDLNTAAANDGRRMQQLSQELSNIEERITKNPWWYGCNKVVLAKLTKSEIFNMGQKLMKLVANNPSMLEIQFEGETGFGSAVTKSFFVETAKEFLKHDIANDMWIVADNTRESLEYCQAGRRGLLIRPTICPNLEYFKFFGRLIARAIVEGYIVPLPIPASVFSIIRDPSAPRRAAAMPQPHDGLVGEFSGAVVALNESQTLTEEKWLSLWATPIGPGQTSTSSATIRLADAAAVFLETGYSGEELIPQGADTSVTWDNVSQFSELAKKWYLHSGIESQVDAIRLGIDEVFAVENLKIFSPEELRIMVCGEDAIEWDESSLKQVLKFHDSLTQDDLEIANWLISILVELDNKQRSTFLDFVTSCPRLPPGGLSALSIDVFPEHLASSNVTSPVIRPSSPPVMGTPSSPGGSDVEMLPPSTVMEAIASVIIDVTGYPRSRACVNQLYLPRYRNKDTMRERLIEAMISSVHHDEITS